MSIGATSNRIAVQPDSGINISELVAKKFDASDSNKDQKLSLDEFTVALEKSNFNAARIAGGISTAEIFSQTDTDEDGSISKDEFLSSHGEGIVSASLITLGQPQKLENMLSDDNLAQLLSLQKQFGF